MIWYIPVTSTSTWFCWHLCWASQSTTSGPPKEAMAAMDTKFREFFPKLPKVRRFWLSSKNVFGWNKNCDHLTENNLLVVKEKKWGEMTKDVRVVKRLSLRWVKDKPCFFDQSGCSWIADVAFCAEYWILLTLRMLCKMEMLKSWDSWLLDVVYVFVWCWSTNIISLEISFRKNKSSTSPVIPGRSMPAYRASGDVRGVARRRCSDHWYSGDWDQVEGYPFSSWLSSRWVVVNNDGWAADILWTMMRCYGSWHVYLHDSCIWEIWDTICLIQEVPEHMNLHM